MIAYSCVSNTNAGSIKLLPSVPTPTPIIPGTVLIWYGRHISDIFFLWRDYFVSRLLNIYLNRHGSSKRQLYLVQMSAATLWVDLLIINLLLVFLSFHI